MKRMGHLWPKITEPENLRLAFWKAARGKHGTAQVQAFRANLSEQLALLRDEMLTLQLDVGYYRVFKIYDPKERIIVAASFKERVLHHAIMNVCHARFEKAQIYHSYASRKGKGTYAALEHAAKCAKRYEWYLKLDFRKYFDSIHHPILINQLHHLFKDPALLRIFDQIIQSWQVQPDCGLPIGNLCSQYWANHYLTGLDHFMLEKKQPEAYIRYMDDVLIFGKCKKHLQNILSSFRHYSETILQLTLKEPVLKQVKNGVPFLGYRLCPHGIRLHARGKRRLITKLKLYTTYLQSGEWSQAEFQRRCLPLLAFTRHADTLDLRKKLILRFGLQA